MQRLRTRLTYANAMSTIAVFLALGGGAFAAVSSIAGPGGVIHGCYTKQHGNLRLVAAGTRCSRRERAIAFNQQGPSGFGMRGHYGVRGAPGPQGSQGIPGPRGETGPRGPGATTFGATLEQNAKPAQLAILVNGVTVSGRCAAGSVVLELSVMESGLQTSGTATQGTLLTAADNEGVHAVTVESPTRVDYGVIARESSASAITSFYRIDAHASFGATCRFWGMATPSR
jgi:hypothetical protein